MKEFNYRTDSNISNFFFSSKITTIRVSTVALELKPNIEEF